MTVVTLAQVKKSDVASAGGKGANLGELISLGFPVPPGFVVEADAYSSFIADFEIPGNDDITNTDRFLADIQQRITETNIDETLRQTIERHHAEIEAARGTSVTYAVRSSATAEDLADASFAGQHDTYYYVDESQIILMLKKCWASLWSESAFSYRHSQGIEHRSVAMAVVIQEMVPSVVSGVTFTADPVSGSDSVIITESSWGMGAAIVDGRVSPDQYVVDKKSGHLTSIKISDKKFMVPARLDEDPSRLRQVPAELRRAETLDDDAIDEITHWAMKAEEHFGCHQDLEWAIADDTLYLLQSRPVTVMGGVEDDVPAGRYILFKPVAENFTDPLTPLTQDIVEDLVPSMEIIYGRVYMNFDHLRALLPVNASDEAVAKMAYLSDPPEGSVTFSPLRAIALGGFGYLLYLIMGVFSMRTANMPDDFMNSFRDYFERTVADPSISAPQSIVQLFAKFRFFEPAGNMVLLANLVAPRYILLLEIIGSLIRKWAPDMPADTPSLLCSGTEGVLSTEMGREILAMAKVAKELPSVREIILDESPQHALEVIRQTPNTEAFCTAIDNFLAKHGHRALKEFELNSARWEEDPSPVVGMIRNYLLIELNLEDTERSVQLQRDELEADLAATLKAGPFGGVRLAIIRRLVNEAKYYIKLRENSRFFHIMGFYAVRRKILQVEQRLLASGALKCKDDIFYLKWEEAVSLDRGTMNWSDVEDTIRSRRMEHIRLNKLVPPKTIGVEEPSFAENDGTEPTLSGQGASPGHYEGKARVIMDPATNNEIEPGEILVAPYTDPAWTPLFLTANAAVIEVGSYLSHAGTIAREYGMPCVVDVANCTSRIKTGDLIRVDGSNGAVMLMQDNEEATA